MISICTTCKNRSKIPYYKTTLTPFPNFVKSLVAIHKFIDDEVELVVSDWQSTDHPLYEWLPETINNAFDFNIIKVPSDNFSRGKGRNIAFEFARGDKIFFVDADMEFNDHFLFKSIREGFVHFPICWSYYDQQQIDGWWRATGFGNFIADREQMRKIGPWKEKYSWGGEDDDMFLRMSRSFPIIRERFSGFVHQWHPEETVAPKPKKGWFKKLWKKNN